MIALHESTEFKDGGAGGKEKGERFWWADETLAGQDNTAWAAVLAHSGHLQVGTLIENMITHSVLSFSHKNYISLLYKSKS